MPKEKALRGREPLKAVRGIDDALWDEMASAAYNLHETQGAFLTRAIRRELNALREPIAGKIETQRREPLLSLIEVHAGWEAARWAAETRGGKYRGRIPERQIAVLRPALEAALGLPPPAPRGARPPRLIGSMVVTQDNEPSAA